MFSDCYNNKMLKNNKHFPMHNYFSALIDKVLIPGEMHMGNKGIRTQI